jgi:tryptophan 2,3-dioxygenase
MTYWDYIQTDVIKYPNPRTTLPDEMVFMYHQVNELIFKMILWEMKQISYCENIETVFLQKD